MACSDQHKAAFGKKYNLEGKYLILGVFVFVGYKKGMDVFLELRQKLDESHAIVLVGFEGDEMSENGIVVIPKTDSKEELAEIYSAADVFVNPTREDNFPTVNMEALACGTPVITFSDRRKPRNHRFNLWNCSKRANSGFCDGSNPFRCGRKKERYTETMCCRRAKQFDQKNCYESYVALYEDVLKNG